MATRVNQARRPRSSPTPVAAAGCRHHWVIETPNGPMVSGACKLCGEERVFRTSADDYIREDAPGRFAA